MATAGYSSTPLVKKLGIKEGFDVLFVDVPARYLDLLVDLPDIQIMKSPEKETVDFIHLFCTMTVDFEKKSLKVKPFLRKNGMLWVSWPKGSSNIPTNLSRDFIREFLLKNGLVDVKVCAIDADWSALKFVYHIKDRK